MLKLNGLDVEFIRFPNGEFQLKEGIKLKDIKTNNLITFHYSETTGNEDILKLYMLKSHLDELSDNLVELYLTYVPFSRMDRTEGTGLIFTLRYLAKFINGMKFNRVYILEPHSNVSAALFNKVKIIDGTTKILERVLNKDENVLLVYPDEGAKKRYTVNKGNCQIALGTKTRDFATGKITSFKIEGNDTDAKKAIILDDLTSFGGTFVATKEALLERYPHLETVELIVTHAENSMLKSGLPDKFDQIYTTDSILTDLLNWENVKYKNKVTVFSVHSFLN